MQIKVSFKLDEAIYYSIAKIDQDVDTTCKQLIERVAVNVEKQDKLRGADVKP